MSWKNFLIITFIHFFLLYISKNNRKNFLDDKKDKINIILKKKIISSSKSRRNKVRSKISLEALSFLNQDKILEVPQETKKIESFSSSISSSLFAQIQQGLTYPSFLSDINAKGLVKAYIYINRDGLFIEKKSRFESNSKFLKVHIRRILRKTLSKPIRIEKHQAGHYLAYFEFDLGTVRKRGTEIRNTIQAPYFYLYQYGVSHKIDAINNGIAKVLGGISNVLSLIQYLPSSKNKKKMMIQDQIDDYKNDPYWE